jgi:uncharacterized protein (DUF58 family)
MTLTPAPRLAVIALAWAGLGLAVHFVPDLQVFWKIMGVLFGGAAFSDWMRLRRTPTPEATRRINRNLPVGAWSTVGLEIRNGSDLPLGLRVHDLHPSSFEVRGMPLSLDLVPGQWADVSYQLRPPTRGAYQIIDTEFQLESPWRLWRQRRRGGMDEQTLRVYPNFARITHYTLLATDNRLSQMGVRRRQRRGEGNDFHQLREYRIGDTMRQIDWKATSRYRKLISREYQDERDQQVLFLIDCGRRMRHSDAGHIHLDEALNAVLLLSYVSLRQGDAVGFLTFGGVRRWQAPRKGALVVNGLLNATYDLQSTTEAADYISAAGELLAMQRRRALVVLITNSRDENHADLETAVRLLRRKHMLVVADLRETLLDELVAREVSGIDDALRFQAVESYLAHRRQSHERLTHHGARILDIIPEKLPIALVNQYFAIKQAGEL